MIDSKYHLKLRNRKNRNGLHRRSRQITVMSTELTVFTSFYVGLKYRRNVRQIMSVCFFEYVSTLHIWGDLIRLIVANTKVCKNWNLIMIGRVVIQIRRPFKKSYTTKWWTVVHRWLPNYVKQPKKKEEIP